MNTTEHLAAIVRHIDGLLAKAEKRTPGKWLQDTEEGLVCFFSHESDLGFDTTPIAEVALWADVDEPDKDYKKAQQEAIANADFITTCAGNAEAGWRATKAAIEVALDCQSWDGMIKEMYIRPDAEAVIDAILAAWPVELLKEGGA